MELVGKFEGILIEILCDCGARYSRGFSKEQIATGDTVFVCKECNAVAYLNGKLEIREVATNE